MPKYVFHYFDIRGRGEPGRMLFAVAGVPFSDDRIAQEKWPELKPKIPGGSLPYLEVDGQILTQSLVIFRHLARIFGLDGETLVDKARVEEIMEYLAEMKEAFFNMALAPDDKKPALQEKATATLVKCCTEIERVIASSKSSNGWAIGKKMSFADIFLYEAFEMILQMESSALDKFGRIAAVRQKVADHPKLKEYLKNRKQTPF